MQPDRKRLAVEAAAIFFSVLLAFWVDAAWDARVERQRAEELLVAIRVDVEATRQLIEARVTRTENVSELATALLTALSQGEDRATRDARLLTIGAIFVQFDWNPVNHSYEQALGSGSFELVTDPRMRMLLGQYVSGLEEVAFWAEVSMRQYESELEPFMVANTIYSELAAPDVRETLVPAPFETDLDALAESRELWNLVTFKLELEGITRLALLSALDRADELLIALSGG